MVAFYIALCDECFIYSFAFTTRYRSLCGLSSSSCGGLRPSVEVFLPLKQKKKNFLCCFCLFVVFSSTPVTLSRNFSNLKKKIKTSPKYPKISKIFKIIFFYPIKIPKNPKNQLKKLWKVQQQKIKKSKNLNFFQKKKKKKICFFFFVANFE